MPILQFTVATGFFVAAVRWVRATPTSREQKLIVQFSTRNTFLIYVGFDSGNVKRDDKRCLGDQSQLPEVEPASRRDLFLQRHLRTTNLPPIDERDPLLWKERSVMGRPQKPGPWGRMTLIAWVFGLLVAFLLADGITRLIPAAQQWYVRALSPATIAEYPGTQSLLTGATISEALCLLPWAIGLSSAVARERRRQTLESLLMLPESRGKILRTKLQAVVERGWWWLLIAVAAAGSALGFECEDWRMGLAGGAYILTGGWLIVGFGAWLTVRFSTEVLVLRFLAPIVVLVVGVPVAVWNLHERIESSERLLWGLSGCAFGFFAAGTFLCWRAVRGFDRIF